MAAASPTGNSLKHDYVLSPLHLGLVLDYAITEVTENKQNKECKI
jgi:hypothetical protein